jgi:mono/diheme cytochrome c family protein
LSGRLFDVTQSIAPVKRSESRRIGCVVPCRCYVTGTRSTASACGFRFATRGVASETRAMNEQTPPPEQRVRQGMDYGEFEEVQEVHAAIQREKGEPRVGLEPLSIWLIVVYGLAIFFGGAYLGRYSGNFSGDGLDPLGGPRTTKKSAAGPGGGEQQAELSPRDRGKKIFAANCQTCHQANGLGVPGQYPPLAGSEFSTGGSRRPAMIVLKGLQGPVTVKGQKFGSAVMQPWDKTLTDQKIADVLTYERSEWGNNASAVTAEQIAALRKELANHPDSFTEPDLLAVPPDAEIPGGTPAGAAPPKPGEAAKPGAPAQSQPSPAASVPPKA